MLAIWRNCPRSVEPQVYRYLERAAKHIMKFKGEEFVEFFRRVLDYPRRDMINPSDPDFADLVNKSVAKACGAKVYLPPETFYEFTALKSTTKKSQPRKKVVPWSQQRDKGNTKGQEKWVEGVKVGPEKTPLDGSKSFYVGGPFLKPKEKLNLQHCYFCWNRGLPCKYLAQDEVTCRKLHICSHADCRTLYHHGHRAIHHTNQPSG